MLLHVLCNFKIQNKLKTFAEYAVMFCMPITKPVVVAIIC